MIDLSILAWHASCDEVRISIGQPKREWAEGAEETDFGHRESNWEVQGEDGTSLDIFRISV